MEDTPASPPDNRDDDQMASLQAQLDAAEKRADAAEKRADAEKARADFAETELAKVVEQLRHARAQLVEAVKALDAKADSLLQVRKDVGDDSLLVGSTVGRCWGFDVRGSPTDSKARVEFVFRGPDGKIETVETSPRDARAATVAAAEKGVDRDLAYRLDDNALWWAIVASSAGARYLAGAPFRRSRSQDAESAAESVLGLPEGWLTAGRADAYRKCHVAVGSVVHWSNEVARLQASTPQKV